MFREPLIFDKFRQVHKPKDLLSFFISSRTEASRDYLFIYNVSMETQKSEASPETKALNTWY